MNFIVNGLLCDIPYNKFFNIVYLVIYLIILFSMFLM